MMISRRRQRGLTRAVVAAGALLITGIALLPLKRDDRLPSPPENTPGAAAGRAPPVISRSVVANAAVPSAPAAVSVDPALLDTPEARAYLEREQFNERARRFFADAAQADAASTHAASTDAMRAREAQWLDAAIGRYERERQLSAGEAMNLRLGLIQASGLPEDERAARMATVVSDYERDGARREAQWAAQQRSDAAFVQYKSREQAIVADVMAMAQIPDGLSRDEYLRRRLEAERVAAMR